MIFIFALVLALLFGSTLGVVTMCAFIINKRCEERNYNYINERINKKI